MNNKDIYNESTYVLSVDIVFIFIYFVYTHEYKRSLFVATFNWREKKSKFWHFFVLNETVMWYNYYTCLKAPH